MLINILFLLIGYFFLIKIYYKKFPFVALAFFQIILLSSWAHFSTFFIDSQAGIYSIELTKNLESNFSSSYRMLFFLLFLIAPFIVFTKKRIQNLKESFQNNEKIEYNFLSFRVYDIVKFLFTVFLILVFFDIISKPIPLFYPEIGKGEYYQEFASGLVKNFYTYASFISFFIGFFILNNIRDRNKIDYHFVFLFLLILIMFVLLGNKFSALFTSTCFLMIPLSLLFFAKSYSFLNSIKIKYLYIITGITLVLIIINFFSYFFLNNEWSSTYGLAMIGNRLLIQQGQIFSSVAHRVIDLGIINTDLAYLRVFFEPVYSLDGNTSLHFLMYQDIGSQAYTQIEAGYGFTSDLSAILLELFGSYFSYIVYFSFSLVASLLLYILYRSIIEYKYLSVFFGIFVYHSFALSIIGGKLTYFCCGEISNMYLLKISLFLLAYFFESILLKKTNYFQSIN